MTPKPFEFLSHPTRHLFFTGQGGIGKTTVAAPT
jgi:adenylylsulfate kinase-like enzyme